MTTFTPTTERVRQRWLDAYEYERDMPGRIRKKYPDEVLSMFDRWLAEHDRQVAERAWDACAQRAQNMGRLDDGGLKWLSKSNPYRAERSGS